MGDDDMKVRVIDLQCTLLPQSKVVNGPEVERGASFVVDLAKAEHQVSWTIVQLLLHYPSGIL